jgi:hypothetical protein
VSGLRLPTRKWNTRWLNIGLRKRRNGKRSRICRTHLQGEYRIAQVTGRTRRRLTPMSGDSIRLNQNVTAPGRCHATADTTCQADCSDRGDRMPVRLLRMVAVVVFCFSSGAFAGATERPHHAKSSKQGSAASSRSADARETLSPESRLKKNAARTLAADRDPYADPAAPYKADRLASPSAEPILNVPGATVLTREVLDDMNATTLRDALRATAGVTVGR